MDRMKPHFYNDWNENFGIAERSFQLYGTFYK